MVAVGILVFALCVGMAVVGWCLFNFFTGQDNWHLTDVEAAVVLVGMAEGVVFVAVGVVVAACRLVC